MTTPGDAAHEHRKSNMSTIPNFVEADPSQVPAPALGSPWP
jgi:hypothetical protein